MKTAILALHTQTAGIEQIRFGYVNRTANSVLTYEENETDITVFPGKKIIATVNAEILAGIKFGGFGYTSSHKKYWRF